MRIRYPTYLVPFDNRWHLFTEKQIEESTPEMAQMLDSVIEAYQRNAVAFFLAHGAPNEIGGIKGNDGLSFINDWKSDFLIFFAGNQQGKTTHGAAKIILWSVPNNPEWETFQKHSITMVPWNGPKQVIIASYSWDNVSIVWETYRKLLPRYELGAFAPMYGIFPNEKEHPKQMLFGDGKPKRVTLQCGTQLTFLCYTQSDVHWESRQGDIFHLDEQCPKPKFSAATARQLTRGAYTPIIITATPHIVDNRRDTGAAGWIVREIVNGQSTMGRKVSIYRCTMESVPDAIISPEKKGQAYIEYITEPEERNDLKRIRSGRARYYGEPEIGGGLVFSDWEPSIHMIEPFDVTRFKPTYFRMIDHGQNPCAAILFALFPTGDIVGFREYYEFGRSIGENARGIVETLCGNERVPNDEFEEPWLEEKQSQISFYASEMDSRSFGTTSPESKRTIGVLYNENGLYCSPADGQKDHILFPLLSEHLALNMGRTHINARLGRSVPKLAEKFGSPKLYFFNDMSNTKAEFDGFMLDEETQKPLPYQPDHLISCCKFLTARPRYRAE